MAPGIEVATTAPASPVPTSTATFTTILSSLVEEVTYTYTGFSTPLVDGEVTEAVPTGTDLLPPSTRVATLVATASAPPILAAKDSGSSSIQAFTSATGLLLLLVIFAML